MNYDTAKAICSEHAPQLHLGPDTGMRHVNVYKDNSPGSPPFSISIPNGVPLHHEFAEGETVETFEKAFFEHLLDIAVQHFKE